MKFSLFASFAVDIAMSALEVIGSITVPVKSDSVSSKARYRCDDFRNCCPKFCRLKAWSVRRSSSVRMTAMIAGSMVQFLLSFVVAFLHMLLMPYLCDFLRAQIKEEKFKLNKETFHGSELARIFTRVHVH